MAQSLVQELLLPEDVHFFSGANDESLAKRLQWHTIAVTHLPTLFPLTLKRKYFFFVSILMAFA